ncbi:MAG: TIGR02266 family protein [Myxococcales bacterium]|nr:TIGR02266 family protein [Myxococcales bacterium]MDD9970225.1 TIGR02266 family protein [Myxococcales bacterium]
MGEPATRDREHSHRRQAARVDLEVEVSFNDHSNFYVGFSENISEGGLFVATYNLQPVGTEIEIKFGLPDGTEIETVGVVRWVRDPRDREGEIPPGLGIQFRVLTERQLDSIREFTSLQDPIFFPD